MKTIESSYLGGRITIAPDLCNGKPTIQITNMSGLFVDVGEGQAPSFNQDISNWDVSNVTVMSFMFAGEIYHGTSTGASSFNHDISGWDVRNVTNMDRMFYGANAFTNQDLSPWDVSKVVEHSGFFELAGKGNIEPNWKQP